MPNTRVYTFAVKQAFVSGNADTSTPASWIEIPLTVEGTIEYTVTKKEIQDHEGTLYLTYSEGQRAKITLRMRQYMFRILEMMTGSPVSSAQGTDLQYWGGKNELTPTVVRLKLVQRAIDASSNAAGTLTVMVFKASTSFTGMGMREVTPGEIQLEFDALDASYDENGNSLTGVNSYFRVNAPDVTVTPWYRAGGAPLPIAAYQPKGAGSLASSYTNLANPGTFNAAPGTPPSLVAGGWSFVNASATYLTTGLLVTQAWTIICRYTGMSVVDDAYLFGAFETTNRVGIDPSLSSQLNLWNASNSAVSPAGGASATLAIAGPKAYRDGSDLGVTFTGTNTFTTRDLWIGGLNNGGALYGAATLTVAAFVAYNTTLSAAQVLAVTQAMQAL